MTEFNSRISSNFVRVIGTGERCLPGDADNCGDGGKAVDARLSYPKGEYISAMIARIVGFKEMRENEKARGSVKKEFDELRKICLASFVLEVVGLRPTRMTD